MVSLTCREGGVDGGITGALICGTTFCAGWACDTLPDTPLPKDDVFGWETWKAVVAEDLVLSSMDSRKGATRVVTCIEGLSAS
jgi:hypothetical protein